MPALQGQQSAHALPHKKKSLKNNTTKHFQIKKNNNKFTKNQ
jgi:hypothetical protein